MSEADRLDPEVLIDDLADGPPDPDDGWVHSVEETFDSGAHASSATSECPGCGETFRPGIDRHVVAMVRLRDVDRDVRVRLCSWECWQEWATR